MAWQFCSIRSRLDRGAASRPTSAPMGAMRTRDKISLGRGGPSPPAWDELSRRYAIEMQPSVLQACTPVALSPITLYAPWKQRRSVTTALSSWVRHIGTHCLRPFMRPLVDSSLPNMSRRCCWASTPVHCTCAARPSTTLCSLSPHTIGTSHKYRGHGHAYLDRNPPRHDRLFAQSGSSRTTTRITHTGMCRSTFPSLIH
jgi:hypothetical protein